MEKPKKSKSLCSRCYNDGYNHGLGGAQECFSYKAGKVSKRLSIRSDQMPPYNRDNWSYMMSCFNRKMMCYPSPDVITKEGYWK